MRASRFAAKISICQARAATSHPCLGLARPSRDGGNQFKLKAPRGLKIDPTTAREWVVLR